MDINIKFDLGKRDWNESDKRLVTESLDVCKDHIFNQNFVEASWYQYEDNLFFIDVDKTTSTISVFDFIFSVKKIFEVGNSEKKETSYINDDSNKTVRELYKQLKEK